MKLGIGSYTYTWAVGVPVYPPPQPLDAFALLRRARDLGVRVAQYCDNLPLTELTPNQLDRLSHQAREFQIDLEIGTRGIADRANLLACLDLARRFGSSFLRLVIDSRGHEPSPEQTAAILQPLLPKFAEARVKLALENHDRFSSRVLAGLVEKLGPEQVGVCLDTVNSFGALEGPEVVVNTLAPYTLNLHVKDFVIERVGSQMGFTVSGCPVGQGRLNVPWLLEKLRAAGRDVNAIIELWTPFAASLPETLEQEARWAEQSVRYLRQFVAD